MASDPAAVEGRWFLPGAGRAVAARLSFDADGIASVTGAEGEQHAAAHRSRLIISDRVASIPRRIDFPEAGSFETPDNDGVDRLVRPFRRSTGVIHGLERFHPRLIAFVALAVVLCLALYRFALPVMIEVAVTVTPPVVPAIMSRGALASLDETILAPSTLDEARRQTISAGFDTLAALTPSGEERYTLHFRKGGAIGPNAFALPDGTIVLTDELVALAGGDDEAIIGVLGHEIGHVKHEHSLRRLYQAAGVAGLIMLIGGDIGAGAEEILVQASALVTLSYSRAQESEADRHSVDLMLETGRDPAALVRFFELLRDRLGDTDETDFLSTHPATPARIEAIRRYAAEAAAK